MMMVRLQPANSSQALYHFAPILIVGIALLSKIKYSLCSSDSFTILGLWVLGLATSNINESPLQTNESKTLFLMTSLPNYCIQGLAGTHLIKTYAQKMQGAQVTKSLVFPYQTNP